jgi:hypothetical protein
LNETQVGEKIQDNVIGAFDVLRGQTVLELSDQGAEFVFYHLDDIIGGHVGRHLAQLEEPVNGRGVVANCKDIFGERMRFQANEPNVDDHANELKEVVDNIRAKYEAEWWDLNAPTTSGEGVATNAEWVGIAPGNLGGLPSGDVVQGDAKNTHQRRRSAISGGDKVISWCLVKEVPG